MFDFAYHVLPDEKNMCSLAERSIALKDEINRGYGKKVPQPIDSLNLFAAVYSLLGKPTRKIESSIARLRLLK